MFKRESNPTQPINTVSAPRHIGLRAGAILTLAAIGIVGLGAASLAHPVPRLIWNASASAPLGFYWVLSRERFSRGDLVLAQLPPAARALAAERHYLPAGVPVVKRVAALAGATVCSLGLSISIDGRVVAERRLADSRGRTLPIWQGCRVLADGDAFLLMPDVPDSFDGRYFGVTETTAILGKLVPLWTW